MIDFDYFPRGLVLCWEDKATGLRGKDELPGTYAPGEEKMWLDRLHRENIQTYYWFEEVKCCTSFPC